MGEIDEVGQKVQTSSYKVNKSWGYDIQHGDCMVYLKVVNTVNLQFSSQEKKFWVTMQGYKMH